MSLICCSKQSIVTLHELRYEILDSRYVKKPFLNKVCCNCYSHWYGEPDSLKKYSRNEWDEMINKSFEMDNL